MCPRGLPLDSREEILVMAEDGVTPKSTPGRQFRFGHRTGGDIYYLVVAPATTLLLTQPAVKSELNKM